MFHHIIKEANRFLISWPKNYLWVSDQLAENWGTDSFSL